MTFTGSLSKPPLILEWEPSEVPLMSGVGQDTPSGTEFFSSLGSSMCGVPGCDDDLWWDLLWVFHAAPGNPVEISTESGPFMPQTQLLSLYRNGTRHGHPKHLSQEVYELLFPCFNQLNEYCKLLLSCHVCCHGNFPFRFTLFFNGLFGFDLPRLATTIFVAKLLWRVSVCLAQFLVD